MISLPTSSHIPEPKAGMDVLRAWRKVVFNRVIKAAGIIGSVVYFLSVGLLVIYKETTPSFLFSYTLAYLLLMVAAYFTRIPTIYRAYLFTSIVFVVGIAASIESAAIGDGRMWLVLSVILAIIFLGRRAGWIFTIIAVTSWGVIGYLFNASIISPSEIEQFSFSIWGGTTLTLFIVGLMTILTMGALLGNLNETIAESYSLTRKSKEQSRELEEQRNALERRSNTLEASAKISRKLASLIAHHDIVKQMPKLLHERFGLNSAAVFLLDAENALRLASCKGWNEQAHPTRDYVLSLEEDIVGLAFVEGKAFSNAESEKGLNAALSETRSYVAIPLRGRSKVIGVLLLQSENPEAFGAERVSVLQILADQVALLLENADLLAKRESALEAERRAYGEVTQTAWGNLIKSRGYGSYRRDENGLTVVPTKSYHPKNQQVECEQMPIKIRGKVVGYIDAHKPKNRAWTASEKELLRILASRLETAMDSARLYQDSQERAERERIIGETSARMRETLDIESVLETAARELRNTLGIATAEVWIGTDDEAEDLAKE